MLRLFYCSLGAGWSLGFSHPLELREELGRVLGLVLEIDETELGLELE